jgi:ubiquinone/menaquinone biosynthesis C-methylase UbiE
MKPAELKKIVQEKYSQIASQPASAEGASCCGPTSCCSSVDYTIFSESYKTLQGYHPDADLGLGCGIPTQFAGIRKGDRVLDLGSGAGNDCFVARAIVGETGQVMGLDFTEEMLQRATRNAQKLGFTNVRFVRGDIENIPLPDGSFDVVVSNCVLNLVPDKAKAFSGIMRVLVPGGHFCISDVVIKGSLPESLRKDAELYAGCVSGAMDIDLYMNLIRQQGFEHITLHKQKPIELPEQTLQKHLSDAESQSFSKQQTGIFSITVSGYKPS